MSTEIKIMLIRKGLRQTRMAMELGWDPAKLSRIVNGYLIPNAEERANIAAYLEVSEDQLFSTRNDVGIVSSREERSHK